MKTLQLLTLASSILHSQSFQIHLQPYHQLSHVPSNARRSFHRCHVHQPGKEEQEKPLEYKYNSRRSFLASYISTSPLLFFSSFLFPQNALAAKGAAEYDLEFYLRDLVKGNNNPGGNITPSAPPPKAKSRTLTSPLISLLMDDFSVSTNLSYSSIPAKRLLQILQQSQQPQMDMDMDAKEAVTTLTTLVTKFLSASKRGFYSKAPWINEEISDQYYFDLTSYAFYRATAKLIPDFTVRQQFVNSIGQDLYKIGKDQGFFVAPPVTNQKEASAYKGPLTQTIPVLTQILNTFSKAQFIKGYKLGGTKNENMDKIGGYIFDELDDDDISNNGYSVDCLISVYEPATLGAALQITAEGSRFSPDFLGPTLVAMWADYGIKASYETYFVDQEYRPNPKDFFPNEQLYQFSLKM